MHLTEDVRRTVRERYTQHIENPHLPPRERLAAGAVLVALDSDGTAARAALRAAAMPDGVQAALPEGDVVALSMASVICDDLEMASALLTGAADPPTTVRVEWRRAEGPPTCIGCVLAGPGETVFRLAPGLDGARGLLTLLSRWLACVPMMLRASALAAGRPGRVRLHLNDGAQKPGLGFCARSEKVVLVPDPDFLRSRGYATARAHLAANPIAWADRHPIALWRGASNGHRAQGEGWRTLQRVRLCESARDPALFDVGIASNTLPRDDPGRAELPASGLMRAPIDAHRFAEYRYQIDIDGFTNAWSGLFHKLLTGSTVLKIASPGSWRQWYYDRLIPWEHFVPVSADLGDLEEKVRWLAAHDDQAARIGAAGQALALGLAYEGELEAAAHRIAAQTSAQSPST